MTAKLQQHNHWHDSIYAVPQEINGNINVAKPVAKPKRKKYFPI